jgi:hypothetical protein
MVGISLIGSLAMKTDRRRLFRALVWVPLLPLALAACGSLPGGPRQVDISERKLLALMSEQFPLKRRYLELFEVSLSDPSLRLMPEQNRIGTRLNFAAGMLLSGAKPWNGQMELSYGLRYQASDQTVRLDAVRLEAFEFSGAPIAYAQALRGAGAQLAENLLQDMVVHRFKPEDLRRVDGMGYQPGSLMVVPGGLRLQLDPKPPV